MPNVFFNFSLFSVKTQIKDGIPNIGIA